jgi:SAM-dependent methyltransferase
MMGCCGEKREGEKRGKDAVRETVREGYARIAQSGGSCCADRSCRAQGMSPEEAARSVGYSAEELAGLPEGANMDLSCGNPTALSSLRPGEVVLDLGSGGGFDVFVSARKVGPQGRAIGVDMTPEMVSKARRNAEQFRASSGLGNVEFRLGEIEHLPVADASVDVVISNCVINLSPDKPQVWREIARVLKPGGRVAVSDLGLLRALPEAVLESARALVGCVAGAVLVEETERMAREAGLTEVRVERRPIYSDDPADWTDSTYAPVAELLPPGTTPSDFVVSMAVTARKGS